MNYASICSFTSHSSGIDCRAFLVSEHHTHCVSISRRLVWEIDCNWTSIKWCGRNTIFSARYVSEHSNGCSINWNFLESKLLIYQENIKSYITLCTWNFILSFSASFWIKKEVDNAGVPKSKRDTTLMSSKYAVTLHTYLDSSTWYLRYLAIRVHSVWVVSQSLLSHNKGGSLQLLIEMCWWYCTLFHSGWWCSRWYISGKVRPVGPTQEQDINCWFSD